MAKKKNNVDDDMKLFMKSGMLPPGVDPKEFCMGLMAMAGVTPIEYAAFYTMFNDRVLEVSGNDSPKGNKLSAREVPDSTLVLKIQMKDVTKPPMWREVKVSSRYTFFLLHEVIQELMGLDDYHLWQFNRTAYNSELQIGIENEECGLDEVTHDADSTTLGEFFVKPGDKLEYVYDFGDDWIFTVTLKKIIDEPSSVPVCVAYKSDLNAIEDCGGTWGYMEIRSLWEDWDKRSVKERKLQAQGFGFEKADDLYDYLQSHTFDLDDCNLILSTIILPDSK